MLIIQGNNTQLLTHQQLYGNTIVIIGHISQLLPIKICSEKPFSAVGTKYPKFSAELIQDRKYSASVEKDAGFSAQLLRDEGFSATPEKDPSFSATLIRSEEC